MVLSSLVEAVQSDVIEPGRDYASHYSSAAVFNLCEWVEEKWRKNGCCCLYLYNSAVFR